MAFVTASLSNPGGRAVNEDSCGFVEAGGAGCWVVCDGLGGHGGGSTASRLAVDAVLNAFRANPTVTVEGLRSQLAAANAAIRGQQSEPSLSHMRSTIVALVANGTTAVCGHMGDSRLYQFHESAVRFQTVDHSVPGALAAGGSIEFDAIRFHEDRNRVLRSLGNEGEFNPVIIERTLCQGDAFLLCTDGFWEYVTELEMEADSVKTSTPEEWLRFMASRLLGRTKPDNDNWTAMAVFFRSASAPVTEMRKGSAMTLTEKLSWAAIASLTATLVLFLGVARYPQQVAQALKLRPQIPFAKVNPPLPAPNGSNPPALPEPARNRGPKQEHK
jgi:PPM family protein phosphatase